MGILDGQVVVVAARRVDLVNEVAPLGRIGTSDDVAKAALFLCGPSGNLITGQTLSVDDGASLLMLPTPQMFADVYRRWSQAQTTPDPA